MTTQPEEREPISAEAKQYVQRLIDDVAQLRLPELFTGDYPDARYRIKNRNGVSVVALPTTSLTPEQHIKLMRYRLAQYLSVGFIDPEMVYQKRLEHEPLTNLRPRDAHYIATSVDGGEILCYMVLEAPPDAAPGATLRDRDRPLFPVEEVHGYGIYNRLRILPDLPLAKVYELGRFVKNQCLHSLSELGTRGPVEVMAAVIRSAIGSLRLEVEALVGDFEEGVAKQNFEFFHLPKVVVHGTVPYVDRDAYLYPRYQLCVVYPWAALLADFAAPLRARLDAIERALELPGKQALLELFKLKRQAADVRSGLLPPEGLAPLTDAALPQKGVTMPERLELLGKAGRLRETGLLSHLGLAETAVLCSFMERVRAQPGDVIVHQGDTSDDLYLIESGQAQVQITNRAGQVVPLAVLGPNDYFGEVALLTGGERTADVVALTPLALLRLGKDAYTRYLSHVVELEQQMALTAVRRAQKAARETR